MAALCAGPRQGLRGAVRLSGVDESGAAVCGVAAPAAARRPGREHATSGPLLRLQAEPHTGIQVCV